MQRSVNANDFRRMPMWLVLSGLLVVVLALILIGLALDSPGEITPPPVAAESIRGDVDGNGTVDSIDAFHLLQFSAGIILPDPDAELYEKVDLNNDGLLDSLDASLILQFHAGLIESLSGRNAGLARR